MKGEGGWRVTMMCGGVEDDKFDDDLTCRDAISNLANNTKKSTITKSPFVFSPFPAVATV